MPRRGLERDSSVVAALQGFGAFWRRRGVTEGFGLPPLEAIACGCTVFSSVNHGLADFLIPGTNAHKIRCTSVDYDLLRICQAIEVWHDTAGEHRFLAEYRPQAVANAWEAVLHELNAYFDCRAHFGSRIDPADNLKKPHRYLLIAEAVMHRLRLIKQFIRR